MSAIPARKSRREADYMIEIGALVSATFIVDDHGTTRIDVVVPPATRPSRWTARQLDVFALGVRIGRRLAATATP